MKLAPAFRDALRDVRQRCGGMIAVTLDGLGYVAVPRPYVDMIIRLLERDDERRAAEPNGPDHTPKEGDAE